MSGPASPTPRFRIMLLNDDYTPMEFVVAVLEDVFKMTREEATLAMLNTHRQGRYAVATLDQTEAEATIRILHERARQAGHPFQCTLEADASSG
jgi:ATP-dependent Clp protease adaptor protein ClpS